MVRLDFLSLPSDVFCYSEFEKAGCKVTSTGKGKRRKPVVVDKNKIDLKAIHKNSGLAMKYPTFTPIHAMGQKLLHLASAGEFLSKIYVGHLFNRCPRVYLPHLADSGYGNEDGCGHCASWANRCSGVSS